MENFNYLRSTIIGSLFLLAAILFILLLGLSSDYTELYNAYEDTKEFSPNYLAPACDCIEGKWYDVYPVYHWDPFKAKIKLDTIIYVKPNLFCYE